MHQRYQQPERGNPTVLLTNDVSDVDKHVDRGPLDEGQTVRDAEGVRVVVAILIGPRHSVEPTYT